VGPESEEKAEKKLGLRKVVGFGLAVFRLQVLFHRHKKENKMYCTWNVMLQHVRGSIISTEM